MIQSILAGIVALLQAIPFFDKWFSKTATEKVEKKLDAHRDNINDAKKTGRPSWD